MRKLLLGLLLLPVLNTTNLHSQSGPYRGVIWTPPSDPSLAHEELEMMSNSGINAVRTPLVQNESILNSADNLGIQIFQDLPIVSLSHTSMMEKLISMEGIMLTVLQRAKRHRSTRHFGIFTNSDNSEPEIRTQLQSILKSWRDRAPEGSYFYFIPAFLDDDCCSSEFDFVLLEAADNDSPKELHQRWLASNDTPAGYASFGLSWTDVAEVGHAKRNSIQRSARFLEREIPSLLSKPSIPAIFVNKWKDEDVNLLAGDRFSGLINEEGQRSFVHEVLSGIYSDRQVLFAINSGEPDPIGPPHWAIFFAWIIVGLTGLIYGYSNTFQGLIRRYFVGHGFYLQEIKQARNISVGFTLAITCLTTLVFGVLFSTFFSIASELPRFDLAVGILPGGLKSFVLLIESNPWIGLLASMIFYLLYLVLSAFLLVVVSRIGTRITLYQSMLIVVGSRWMLLLPFIASTIALTVPDEYKKWAIYGILVSLLILFLISNGRAVVDYFKLTRVPIIISAIAIIAVPAALVALLIFWGFQEGMNESISFIVNLTRKA